MCLRLGGKRVLITGARGIGFAIAEAFARNNVQELLLVSRGVDGLLAAKKALEGFKNTEVTIKPGKVQDRAFWDEMRHDLKHTDILVNAAGVAHSSLLVTSSSEMLEDVVQTNLMGTIWACQAVAKAMIRQRRNPQNTGCIINIASLLGTKGGKGSTVYAASKAGILGLTRSLAAELGTSNIRVNAIIPGYVETDMTDGITPEARAISLDAIPQKRFGTATEIADAAIFLATNTYANNCHLNLDGGLSAT